MFVLKKRIQDAVFTHAYCTKLGEFNVLAGDLLMTDPSPETHQCHM